MSLDHCPASLTPDMPLPETAHDGPQQVGLAAGASGQNKIFGLVDIVDSVLAIDAANIREAVPFPDKISHLPVVLPGLIGAMVLRNDTIPLVDLSHVLQLENPRPMADRVIVVTLHDGKLVGLVVDALRGMTTIGKNVIIDMAVVGAGPLVAGAKSFVQNDAVISILEPQTVFDIPGMPYSRQHDHAGKGAADHFKTRHSFLLCSYKDRGIAFPIEKIHSTIPLSRINDSPIAVGICDGVIRQYDQDIAIVDTLKFFELGANAHRPERSAAIALKFPGGDVLAFEIDHFFDIVHVTPEDLQPVPAVMFSRGALFRGVYLDEEGKHFFVADADACRHDEGLQQLAQATRQEQPQTTRKSHGRASQAQPSLHLIFKAGNRLACKITDVVELIRMPQHLLDANVRGDGMMGTLNHRNQLVPVFCAASLHGEFCSYDQEKASVLLFRKDGQLYGIAVEQLESVERCTLLESDAQILARPVKTGEFIIVFNILSIIPTAETAM